MYKEEDKPLRRITHSRRMRLIVLLPTCKALETCFTWNIPKFTKTTNKCSSGKRIVLI